MDLSSILPLLLGGKNPQMASILSAMNGGKAGGAGTGSMNDMLASILASQASNQKSDAPNTDNSNPLSKILEGKGGGMQTELLMNLMNSMNKSKPARPIGLNVIQKIAPNDILGILLKHYNQKTS